MNRLVTRLTLAILLAILLSIALIIGLQTLFFYFLEVPNMPQQIVEIEKKLEQGSNVLTPEESKLYDDYYSRLALPTFIRATVAGGVVTILVAIGIAFFMSRNLVKPITKISAAAVQIAKGDLSVRANLRAKELTDKSQMSELGRNFNAMAASLEKYEMERRAMIADIAHELRTPITALELRLTVLSKRIVPFDENEVERLQKQVLLLSRLVQDLRTLSLADEGQLSLQKQEVNVQHLLEEMLDTYKPKALQREIQLHRNLQPLTATLDPERFGQIFSNLLDNALRVTPSGGVVTVTLGLSALDFTLQVSDTGPGIPNEDLPHIFERFVQARDTKGASTKGSSGLGLAIAQTLVQLHGGTISASNRLEGGAVFTVTLPITRIENKTRQHSLLASTE